MILLSAATDANPYIIVYDPPTDSAEGRVCLVCDFTRLFVNRNSAPLKNHVSLLLIAY
jgi:hypothetical protein